MRPTIVGETFARIATSVWRQRFLTRMDRMALPTR
jgi:hypothetical protein